MEFIFIYGCKELLESELNFHLKAKQFHYQQIRG